MSAVATWGPGMSMAMPDVCMTPPLAIPAPFPNIASNALAIPAYFTIMINGMPELNTLSTYAITSGDEGGTFGGVASGTVVGPGRPMMGSAACFVGGAPSWRLTAPTLQNLTNAPGTTLVPSQTTRLVLR
ncbi:MAG: DUF4150 domain-containing protein [Immundisolibacterales bacterium]|nr:DUF4150 domain-containing protein [Immundisolibacterales bacterium]